MKKPTSVGWKKQMSGITNISAMSLLNPSIFEPSYPLNLAGMVLLNTPNYFLQNPSFQQTKL